MSNRSVDRGSSSEPLRAAQPEVDHIFLNESLYQLHKPPGTPNMQILFFHGIEFERSNAIHLNTWRSRDGEVIWPEKWLAEDFPRAQILCVCYNGAVREHGNLDMYLIRENLMSDMIQSGHIGQEINCPVILVGHCLGGMVIKEFCLVTFIRRALMNNFKIERVRLHRFLENIKGIFYYSTPHHGNSFLLDDGVVAPHLKNNELLRYLTRNALLRYFQQLNKEAARLNHEFSLLTTRQKWRIYGLGAYLPTNWGPFPNVDVVPEASARQGDSFNMIAENHYSICKPESTRSSGYNALKRLLDSILSDINGVDPIRSLEIVHQFEDGMQDIYIGLKERANIAQKKLANATVLGIVGMGGVGKTTIARQVFKNSSGNFEHTIFLCFTDDVKDMAHYKLINWVLNHLYESGAEVDGRRKDWSSLHNKKTLLFIDNATSQDHLNVFPKLEDLGYGSHLIITSRDKGILQFYSKQKGYAVDTYEVQSLENEEARELFCQHAFGVPGIPMYGRNHHLEEHVKRVVEKCQGLPLTLEVMGAYLRDHDDDASFWDVAIEELGEGRPFDEAKEDRVWARLRISYDALTTHDKEMFIEAATIFFGQPVEKALAAWSTRYPFSESRWEKLLRTFMVKQVYRSKWDSLCEREIKYLEVWVHEHLRDLAKKHLKGKVLTGLSEEANKSFFLVNESWVRSVNALQLQGADEKYPTDLDDGLDEFLTTSDEDLSESSENHITCLSSSLNGDFTNLKYLELDGVDEELGGIFLLQLSLLIWNSRVMSPLPRISLENMKNLAVLELANWVVPEEFPRALGKLVELRILCLRRLKGLDCLPEAFGNFSRLKKLELVCLRLSKLPDSFGKLSKLEHLTLVNVSILELPESFGDSRSLVTLTIRSCKKLSSLPISFGCLSSLRELYINDCPKLSTSQTLQSRDACSQELRCAFQENLPALEYVSLKQCPGLGRLPASFKDLSALEELVVDDCNSLLGLSSDLGQCKALKRLTIKGNLGDTEALSNSFGNFSALTHLSVEDCLTLEELPTSFEDLSTLEELALRNCTCLQKLPENFGKLTALKRLTIEGAYYLESLPTSVVHMCSLREVTLIACGDLKRLQAGDGDTELTTTATDGVRLFVKDCPSLNKDTLPRMGWVEFENKYWYPKNRPDGGQRSGLDAQRN